jgi:hypothetical protein
LQIEISNTRCDYDGFSSLALFAHKLDTLFFEDIEINMSKVSWFDANMCAPLGAILYKAGRNANTVSIANVQSQVESILSKNGFLSNYGHPNKMDIHGTTIPYERFNLDDDRYFGSYINKYLQGKGIPTMSLGLRKKFLESIFEIYSNAVIHSQTQLGIYSCGQFFPTKRRLDFSIADLGMGIGKNLRENASIDLQDDKAIEWAMTGRNTTKKGPIPGGLGLKLLKEFILVNSGAIQIVSGKGYWELRNGQTQLRLLPYSFSGTVVNIEFNTADTSTYCLTSEITPDQIF